jgi:hypothetical protein
MRLPFALHKSAVILSACLLAVALVTSSCVSAYKESIGGETEQTFSRVYYTDFNTSWQSVLEALKHSRLDVSNREGGFVQTKWTDNTDDRNFIDSFGDSDAYLKAQYRFKVTVAKTFFNGKPAIKVTVQRDQLVQRDVLEGWQPIETDSTEENTLLYRVGRLIMIKMKLARIEEEKTRKALESTNF